jgi:hypothetical protein
MLGVRLKTRRNNNCLIFRRACTKFCLGGKLTVLFLLNTSALEAKLIPIKGRQRTELRRIRKSVNVDGSKRVSVSIPLYSNRMCMSYSVYNPF